MKKRLLRKRIKTGGVYLGFDTLRGRKFPYGNFRTSVFCEVKTQIVGKTKFFDSLKRQVRACRFSICGDHRRSGDAFGFLEHIIDADRVAACRVIYQNVRHRADQPAVLNDR